MQQLLGDKVVDGSFLRELFLQRLSTNVRMVLASAHDDSTSIEKLAQLVDKVVEVVAPTCLLRKCFTSHRGIGAASRGGQ